MKRASFLKSLFAIPAAVAAAAKVPPPKLAPPAPVIQVKRKTLIPCPQPSLTHASIQGITPDDMIRLADHQLRIAKEILR